MKTPRSTKAEQSAAEQGSAMVPDTAGTSKLPGSKPDAHPLVLVPTKTEHRVDSRLLARQLGTKHKSVMALIDRYAERIKAFGQLPFRIYP